MYLKRAPVKDTVPCAWREVLFAWLHILIQRTVLLGNKKQRQKFQTNTAIVSSYAYCRGSPVVLTFDILDSDCKHPWKWKRKKTDENGMRFWRYRWFDYDGSCLLSCCAVPSARSLPTFRWKVTQPSSWWKNEDTGCIFLRNVGKFLPHYMASFGPEVNPYTCIRIE
jgi:hypothetical protein